ncbi:MAG: universal stress protein [Bacteroidota bacterium]|nr:universal stress protein [Bacteroidota bacterium]
MKNIIVAIDFSKCSIRAIEYAIAIANKIEANVSLVWVNKPNEFYADIDIYHKVQMDHARKNIELLVEKYKNELKKGVIDYKIRSGKVFEEIVNQAKYSDSYMIIAGTHGVSGFEEFWIGSNAYRIVSYSEIPVITIRCGFKTNDIRKIVVPIDCTLDTRQKVPFVTELAKLYNAEVYITAINTTGQSDVNKLTEKYALQAKKYFDSNSVINHYEHLKGDNESKMIIDYAKKIDADLISMMTEQPINKLQALLGSNAQALVNHSPIPVLSIKTIDTYEIK